MQRDASARIRAGLPAFVRDRHARARDCAPPRVALEIGARGSMHTVVKMLNPLSIPALRLVSVTHPDYLERMRECFAGDEPGVLLLRGAEGEAVAHPDARCGWNGSAAKPEPVVVASNTCWRRVRIAVAGAGATG